MTPIYLPAESSFGNCEHINYDRWSEEIMIGNLTVYRIRSSKDFQIAEGDFHNDNLDHHVKYMASMIDTLQRLVVVVGGIKAHK